MAPVELIGRPLAASVDELIDGCTSRQPMVPPDSKSGARFEWIVRDGQRFVLKYQDARDDWLMRATRDLDGRRFVAMWASGLLDAVPNVIDHTVVGAAVEGSVGAVLQRDVSPGLLPLGDEPLVLDDHLAFLDHMAQLHAAFWSWKDTVGLTSLQDRYLMMSPAVASDEAARGSNAMVPKVMAEGWDRFGSVAPRAADVVMALLDEPAPLIRALERQPHTFVHGDWKAANLGRHPDGRTILLDWGEVPGEASPVADLAWYLALNAARMPQSKEDTIATYRDALERRGVDTGGWWEETLDLELLGTMLQYGWEKAFGGPGPELEWWEDRATRAARWLR
jgi:hypothetical protein